MATPSVAMIPSGYKDGTLYNVLPNNATGDFDVTRGSLATRVNKDGLIEPVGTLGADVVLNGDFEELGADQVLNGDFSQEGAELVTNGDFATDSDWAKGFGATISGGKGNIIGDGSSFTNLTQSNVFTIGKNYKVTVDVTINSGLGLKFQDGATNSNFGTATTSGSYTFYGTANDSAFVIGRKDGATAFDSSIDNVSVVEVGQDWTLGDGWSIGDDVANSDGVSSNSSIHEAVGGVNNTIYKISGTVSNYVSGTLNVGGSSNFLAVNSNGDFVHYRRWSTDSTLYLKSVNFVGSITNITVEEVGQEWTLTDGCSITAQGARITSDGTNQSITQINALVVGDTYEMEYEITESVSGVLSVDESFGSGILLKNTVGVHKFYGVATNDFIRVKRGNACDITIDNIKIKRLNGDDTPRIDYTDGGCPVLLTEPQSTNLITDSNDFSDASWTKSAIASIPIGFTSPDGSSNATKIIPNTANSTHRVKANLSVVSGDYTHSIFAKKGEYKNILLWDDALGSGIGVNLDDLSVFRNVNNQGYKIENYGNDWIRISVTLTFASQPLTPSFYVYDNSATPQLIFSGNDVDGLYIYGAQIEELSYPTSLIPTYGSVRTRLQDTVTGAGTSSDFNSEEGVLFFEGSALADALTNRYITISDGTTANNIRLYYSNSSQRLRARYYVGGVAQCSFSYDFTDVTQLAKIAFKWKVNDFALWVNGVEVGSDNVGTVLPPNTFDSLDFRLATIEPLFGKTSQVQVFKTALTDAELQTLTTI